MTRRSCLHGSTYIWRAREALEHDRSWLGVLACAVAIRFLAATAPHVISVELPRVDQASDAHTCKRTLLSCIRSMSSFGVGLCSSGSSVVGASRLGCSSVLSLFFRSPWPVILVGAYCVSRRVSIVCKKRADARRIKRRSVAQWLALRARGRTHTYMHKHTCSLRRRSYADVLRVLCRFASRRRGEVY